VKTFDYLIVGAGSTGAALAARLSENPSTEVLLLEAGPGYRAAEAPPEMLAANNSGLFLENHAQFTWPELTARRAEGQQPRRYLRGRGLGGSSAVNDQIAIRGVPADFDRWAELGCDGWAWADVLPALFRLEDDPAFARQPYHGAGGPIPIHRTPLGEWGSVAAALGEAAQSLGYGWCDDHNAPDGTGVSPLAMNSRDGKRVSTNDAYLEPARERPNLTILGESLVERVLFDGRRAAGVEVVQPGGGRTTFSGQEIIVSAGAIHSPALLMRSGVGPAAHLRSFGIPVLQDAPVGENLLDHPAVAFSVELKPAARLDSHLRRDYDCVVRYSSGLADAGENDMFILSANLNGFDEQGLASGYLEVAVYQAFSQGAVRLQSPEPLVDPRVEFRLLSDERDHVRLRDGVRRLLAIVRQPSVGAIAERIVPQDGAPAGIDGLTIDDEIDSWLRRAVKDSAHPAGTCRMGAPDDPRSVVDPACRVIGLDGLRVCDASVMPEVPRANLHLTCVMLGEHLAALLGRPAAGRAGLAH
jgi:choline dehydrogenase